MSAWRADLPERVMQFVSTAGDAELGEEWRACVEEGGALGGEGGDAWGVGVEEACLLVEGEAGVGVVVDGDVDGLGAGGGCGEKQGGAWGMEFGEFDEEGRGGGARVGVGLGQGAWGMWANGVTD